MNVWKVLGRYNNVLVLSKKNSILILEINGKAPKPGDSVRVWNNRVVTGRELKAKLLAHFDEELSLKVFKVPGLLEFLHDISHGFDKKYVHFVKLFVKHLVPSRFLRMNDEEKKIIMKSFPEVFESGPSNVRIRFSVKNFFEYVRKNFPINGKIDEEALRRVVTLKSPILSTEEYDVYQMKESLSKGFLGKNYMAVPLSGKHLIVVFRRGNFPFVEFGVKEYPDLTFFEDFANDKVVVEKKENGWTLIWRDREVMEFELPDKELFPRPEKLVDNDLSDAIFLLNNLLEKNVRFASMPSFGIQEMWWEKDNNRVILVVNTVRFGRVVADVILEGRSLSVRFYVEKNTEELSDHSEELQKEFERLGLVAHVFFLRKDPMNWEGFNAYG
ncbi:hypothetical protein Mc24_03268 [Thermotoga sp. Mc24]|uniref:hypothetical protein n=1 Tax=Thermotoga sp. Mc24 TaxID=1231241 RepID=UPI00054418FF|nr:hypothetical protein [Thermotoga sp. Mc24]KHC92410.1 hypothetical protein Mc24_03268 [Thermotoga sp. Mc24]